MGTRYFVVVKGKMFFCNYLFGKSRKIEFFGITNRVFSFLFTNPESRTETASPVSKYQNYAVDSESYDTDDEDDDEDVMKSYKRNFLSKRRQQRINEEDRSCFLCFFFLHFDFSVFTGIIKLKRLQDVLHPLNNDCFHNIHRHHQVDL